MDPVFKSSAFKEMGLRGLEMAWKVSFAQVGCARPLARIFPSPDKIPTVPEDADLQSASQVVMTPRKAD